MTKAARRLAVSSATGLATGDDRHGNEDFFASFGNALEETFNAKPHDPAKARRRLIKGADIAREQLASGRTREGSGW